MKKFSILLIGLLAFLSLFAQKNLYDAKIYLNDGQVIKGNMFLYDSEPDIIAVEDEEGEITRYQLYLVNFVENGGNLQRSLYYNDKYALFEALVEGEKMSLYRKNTSGDDIFYVLTSRKVYLLEGGKVIVEKGSKTFTTKSNRFKGVLKVLLQSEPELVKRADNIDYNQKDLSDIVVAYNGGRISFIKNEDVESKSRKPNLFVYAQYSNVVFRYFFTNDNQTPSFLQAGVQYYFSRESRHSIKLGVEYGTYTPSEDESFDKIKTVQLSFAYYVDIFRMHNSAIYFNFLAANIGYYMRENDDNFAAVLPRLSPGFGFKYQVRDFNFFVEINNALIYKGIPYNFSAGLSYDL
ncbi:MAG: hypothetical protein GXO88_06280 [Chlorobi bacterium]|nr:hypothetical protein [Chlorobiota bacterium]